MEPLNCVVRLGKDGCEIWNGEQFQTIDQMKVAALLGFKPEQVTIHMLYAGGSFGRRANKDSDYVVEAASIAKAIGGRAPVKLVWLREDDTKAGYYRPAFHHVLEAALDDRGRLIGWRHRLVGQSILMGSAFEAMVKDGVVEQSNFHEYVPIRINEMPKVEVYIVPSSEKPTGIGEPGVPPVAPAVANAIAMATGKRVRNLPISAEQLKA
jgi:CO/xanthine dehydrogenase Mo-binding subunit